MNLTTFYQSAQRMAPRSQVSAEGGEALNAVLGGGRAKDQFVAARRTGEFAFGSVRDKRAADWA